MRLHFFPALLPLAPLLPWLLTALGAVAAAIRAFRDRRRSAGAIALLFAVAATGTWAWQKSRLPSSEEGTRLTPIVSLPQARLAEAAEAPTPAAPAGSGLREAWSYLMAARALSLAAPADDGPLIVGTYEGEVLAISSATGQVLWTLRKSAPILSPAAFFEGLAFVGEGLHTAVSSSLTAIEARSGRALWQREFLGHVESAPAVDAARARLYAVAGPGGVWALQARDGAVAWHAQVGHADSTPLLLEGALWATAAPATSSPGSADHTTQLHDLDPETGKSRFKLELPGQPWGDIQAAGQGLIAFTTGVGQLGSPSPSDRGWSHLFDVSARKLRWSVPLRTMPSPRSALSTALGLVFHVLKSGELVAIRITDGSEAWSIDLGSASAAGPAMIPERGWLAAMTSSGELSVVDACTGQLMHKTEVGSPATASPLDHSGKLVVATGVSRVALEIPPP